VIFDGNEADVKLQLNIPPRRFRVGTGGEILLSDCARIDLADGDMVEVRGGGNVWPVIRRRWGFALPAPLSHIADNWRYVISGKDPANTHLLGYRTDAEAEFRAYEEREQHRRFADLSQPKAES
jgi:hypothetical protein